MKRLSDIASTIFTTLVVGGILILMAHEMITPEVTAAVLAWVGTGADLGTVVVVWLNRLAVVVAVVVIAYMLRQPVKQAVNIGQVSVKMID